MAPSEFDRGARSFDPVSPNRLLYSAIYLRSGHTTVCFEGNQLLPGLIGLSPLNAGHPRDLQVITGSALHSPFEEFQPAHA
jgi:hypothetical protein